MNNDALDRSLQREFYWLPAGQGKYSEWVLYIMYGLSDGGRWSNIQSKLPVNHS